MNGHRWSLHRFGSHLDLRGIYLHMKDIIRLTRVWIDVTKHMSNLSYQRFEKEGQLKGYSLVL